MSHPVDNAVSAVRTYIEQHRAAFLDDLVEWLRIPSVSAQPDHATDVRRSADWLAAKLKETGFPTAEVWPTRGAPAVFAEWPSGDPQAPTVLVYGHHDVQPAAREDGWTSEPFDPVVRENRLYARGAADDKGQVFFHTLGVRAHLAATGRKAPAVNLKLLIEGEEESGSPHFRALVEERAERLTADAVVVSDTGMWSEDTPTVCTGMRGHVLNQPGAKEFLDRYAELLQLIAAGYRREGKRYVTVAVGCTGGKHRSVAMSEKLAARLAAEGVETVVVHRDMGRE